LLGVRAESAVVASVERFALITGACSAARHESMRLRRMNGNGSTGFDPRWLTIIHAAMNRQNIPMNVQLPPNAATLSAIVVRTSSRHRMRIRVGRHRLALEEPSVDLSLELTELVQRAFDVRASKSVCRLAA
jgi:hypothetical protein